ncbi:MAG: TetR/AcrR family transcriptional regulator [Deltaproteobacteria bacterium]|nr:TetR/AcrR family transcriptional regulator [Deltaproteobacteria bacterium]
MASQAERRAKTRNKIIKAAKKLFDKQGFESTSVDQIVNTANVAKGTFYQYYDTKIEILADVIRDEGSQQTREALEKAAKGSPVIPILEAYIQTLCEWFEGHSKIAEALIFSSLKTIGDKELCDSHRYGRSFLMELMKLAQKQGAVRDDVPAGELAKVLGGSLAFSVLAWCKNPQPRALVESMNHSLEIFLHGAKKGDFND